MMDRHSDEAAPARNKAIGMALLVGAFVLFVFESFFWGACAGGLTYWLIRRDEQDMEQEE